MIATGRGRAATRANAIAALAACALAAAVALSGCGLLDDNNSSAPVEGSAAASYGLPRLPAAQGIIESSPSRAVEVLSNFAYRDRDGEGQWANNAQAFDVLDDGLQATLEAPLASGARAEGVEEGAACWIMRLFAYDGTDWHNCTLADIQGGADPGNAQVTVYAQRGLAFADAQDAADFIDALYSTSRGFIVIGADGQIPCAIVKNTTGAVCEISQAEPGIFSLSIHPKSQWEDGTYDDAVAACKKYAEENGCEIIEVAKSVPLFQEPQMVIVE